MEQSYFSFILDAIKERLGLDFIAPKVVPADIKCEIERIAEKDEMKLLDEVQEKFEGRYNQIHRQLSECGLGSRHYRLFMSRFEKMSLPHKEEYPPRVVSENLALNEVLFSICYETIPF